MEAFAISRHLTKARVYCTNNFASRGCDVKEAPSGGQQMVFRRMYFVKCREIDVSVISRELKSVVSSPS